MTGKSAAKSCRSVLKWSHGGYTSIVNLRMLANCCLVRKAHADRVMSSSNLSHNTSMCCSVSSLPEAVCSIAESGERSYKDASRAQSEPQYWHQDTLTYCVYQKIYLVYWFVLGKAISTSPAAAQPSSVASGWENPARRRDEIARARGRVHCDGGSQTCRLHADESMKVLSEVTMNIYKTALTQRNRRQARLVRCILFLPAYDLPLARYCPCVYSPHIHASMASQSTSVNTRQLESTPTS